MAKMGNILFINDYDKYEAFLNKWLGGSVVQEVKNDAGDIAFKMYMFDGVLFGLVKPSQETTNTAENVNGSTNNIMLFFDSKEQVDEFHKKGIEAGMTPTNDLGYANAEESSGPYRGGFQDPFKQYWSVVYMGE